ncbi:hypothetical protein FAIPA1_50109 [Frankia sp. AiPs1]
MAVVLVAAGRWVFRWVVVQFVGFRFVGVRGDRVRVEGGFARRVWKGSRR